MITVIQRKLEHTTYSKIKLLGFFNQIGNIRPIGQGIEQHTFTKLENMEPGEIVASLGNLPDNTPRFTEKTTSLLTLGAKLSIPMQLLHRWQNNTQIDVALQQVIDAQMKAMATQINQFLAYGDSFKVPRTGDRNAGVDFAKGIFNGGTTFGAGDGADDDMTAVGDYQSTRVNAIKALKNAGFEGDKYWIFSDVDTYHQAELGVHQLHTVTFTDELDFLLQKKDIAAWIDSPDFTNPAGESRIVITNPYRNNDPRTEDKDFAYRLLQGYNLDIFPLYNGGLGANAAYEYIIAWSGALEFINTGAIQSSGALTLT